MHSPRSTRLNTRTILSLRGAFTFLEIMVVVVIVGILAAMVVPQMAAASDHARSSAVESGLGAVRSGIAAFRTRAIIAGSTPFPTIAQLRTAGTVLVDELPANPYTGLRTVQEVTSDSASARQVYNMNSAGWNYYVNNSSDPPVCVFYCNSDTATDITTASGTARKASEL